MAQCKYSPADVGICTSTLLPRHQPLDADVMERALRAARAGGVRAISVGPSWADAVGVHRLRELLLSLEVRVRAIEAVVAWTEGPEAAREEAQTQLALAGDLGADILLAATVAPSIDQPRAVEGLAAACELAADAGVQIALEFIPGTAVPDLATAWGMVRGVASSSAGIVMDALHWHHQPGGPDFATLRAIPPRCIPYVQLCDSPPGPAPAGMAYLEYAMSERLPPGKGTVDLRGLMAVLAELGVDPYIATEVFNSTLVAAGPEVFVRTVQEATARVLD